MAIALSDVAVVINGNTQSIIPNTFNYTEGKGEQSQRVVSAGGGSVSLVYSRNVETNFSVVKWEFANTIDTIQAIRSFKSSLNQNTISATGTTPDGKVLTRTFKEAALTINYEVGLGADSTIAVEFTTASAV